MSTPRPPKHGERRPSTLGAASMLRFHSLPGSAWMSLGLLALPCPTDPRSHGNPTVGGSPSRPRHAVSPRVRMPREAVLLRCSLAYLKQFLDVHRFHQMLIETRGTGPLTISRQAVAGQGYEAEALSFSWQAAQALREFVTVHNRKPKIKQRDIRLEYSRCLERP